MKRNLSYEKDIYYVLYLSVRVLHYRKFEINKPGAFQKVNYNANTRLKILIVIMEKT